jgi:hypothetical protein
MVMTSGKVTGEELVTFGDGRYASLSRFGCRRIGEIGCLGGEVTRRIGHSIAHSKFCSLVFSAGSAAGCYCLSNVFKA